MERRHSTPKSRRTRVVLLHYTCTYVLSVLSICVSKAHFCGSSDNNKQKQKTVTFKWLHLNLASVGLSRLLSATPFGSGTARYTSIIIVDVGFSNPIYCCPVKSTFWIDVLSGILLSIIQKKISTGGYYSIIVSNFDFILYSKEKCVDFHKKMWYSDWHQSHWAWSVLSPTKQMFCSHSNGCSCATTTKVMFILR